MYAVTFDMTVAHLKEHYGNPPSAYTEIKDVLYAVRI
jgi:virulence-associated protein VapD